MVSRDLVIFDTFSFVNFSAPGARGSQMSSYSCSWLLIEREYRVAGAWAGVEEGEKAVDLGEKRAKILLISTPRRLGAPESSLLETTPFWNPMYQMRFLDSSSCPCWPRVAPQRLIPLLTTHIVHLLDFSWRPLG